MVSSDAWGTLRTGPERVGSYVVEKELGRGCYGVVYLVRREGLERRFALKVLTAEALRSPETVARFQREAKLASRIQDPGVVAIHDLGQEGRYPYYVMDVVRGPTLQDMIRKGPLPALRAAELVCSIAKTMDAAHRAQVIHRDLKPANVILDEATDRPRVTDFGLAQEQGGMRLTRTGEAVGTPFYMAPEQNLGQRDLDARVDVYALGVILYECLTGQVPFQGANFVEISHAIRRGQPIPPQSLVPSLPKPLVVICLKAMATERDARYQTSGAFAAALQGFLDDNRPAAPFGGGPRPASAPAVRSGSSKVVLVGAAATFLLVGITAAGGWVLVQRRRNQRAAQLLGEARAETQEEAARQRLAELAALRPEGELAAGLASEEARWRMRKQLAAALASARGESLTKAIADAQEVRVWESLAPEREAAVAALLEGVTKLDLARADLELADAARLSEGLGKVSAQVKRARLIIRLRRAAESSRDRGELKALLEDVAGDSEAAERPEVSQVRLRLAELSYLALAREGKPIEVLLRVLDEAGLASESPEEEASLGVLRAEAYRRRARYGMALREAERWTRVNDRERAARAGLTKSLCLLRLERHAEAMQSFDTVGSRYADVASGFLAQAHAAVLARAAHRQGVDSMQIYTARHPDDLDGWVLLATALGRLGRHPESDRAMARALEVGPDHPRVHLMRGVILAERRDWRGSKQALVEAGRLCGGKAFPMLLRVRIQVLIQLKDVPAALQDAVELVEIAPNDAASYVNRSVTRWYSGKQNEAFGDLRQALQINREAAYAAAQGFGAQVVGALRQAEAGGNGAVQPGLQVPRPVPPARFGGGLDEAVAAGRKGGSPQAVLPLFAKALAGAKDDAFRERVVVERLEFLHRRGRYEEVLKGAEAFSKSTTPLGLRARWLQAMSLLWQLRGEALDALASLARADPEGAIGLTANATWNSHRGRNQDGARLAAAAINRDPSFPDAYLSLAFCLNDLRRFRESAAVLQQVSPLMTDHPRYYKALAFVAGNTGSGEACLKAYDRLIELTQPNPYLDAVQRRGWMLYTLRRPKEASADAALVLKRRPDNIAYRWLQGLCAFELGDPEGAAAIWREVNAKAPQSVPGLIRQVPFPKTQEAAAKALGLTIQRGPGSGGQRR